MKILKNIKFSSKILSRALFSKKNTKNTDFKENNKFSSQTAYRSVIFIEKLQIFMKIMKLMKNTEIIKFSIERPYRLVPLPEKLCIFHSFIAKLQFS